MHSIIFYFLGLELSPIGHLKDLSFLLGPCQVNYTQWYYLQLIIRQKKSVKIIF